MPKIYHVIRKYLSKFESHKKKLKKVENNLDRRMIEKEYWSKYLKANWTQIVFSITIYILWGLALFTGNYLEFMTAILPVSIANNLLVFPFWNKTLLILRNTFEKESGIINIYDQEEDLRRRLVKATVAHRLGGSIFFLGLLLWVKFGWMIGVVVITFYLFHSFNWNRKRMLRDKIYLSHLYFAYPKKSPSQGSE